MQLSDTTPPRRRRRHGGPLAPARMIAAGFSGVILIGTLLLMLPISSASGRWTGFVDALFTSTSAVCVTGLIVVDTATYWSGFGTVVILVLIQLGGLGIMLFAALVGLAIIRKISVRSRITVGAEVKAGSGGGDVKRIVGGIVTTSVVIEATIMILLTGRFLTGYGYDWPSALWNGLFHAVSAFNNAGFALYSDNLMPFVSDPWICLPISVAIILGGLGFPVLRQLRREWRAPLHWSMNTRIVLAATGVLLIAGTVFVTVIEWANPATLGRLDPASRLLAGFFHSVQARTAGFNSIDVSQMHDETWLGTDVLMFIGGSPAGTAGGIKVTTFAVLLFIMWTELRGGAAVNIFGKRLSRGIHREAIAVVVIAIGAIMGVVIAVLATTDFDLDQVLFEAVSAFGTVGLSTGITADLPEFAQVLLILLMFLGRVGPLTLGSALALRERRIAYELPKERPVVG